MSSSVDQIKSKLDIVTLVGSYVKLEKAGANFKGKCPFHNEKTPSFFVSPDRGSYYCFGCQAKGDIFTFVQEFEGLDFVGTLKVLAEKAGVELERFDRAEKTENDRLFSILELACFFYQKNLSENEMALKYLHERGVKDSTIKNFRIGFAPAQWRNLHDFLLSKSVTEEDMLKVGLVKISARDGSMSANTTSASGRYDTFRGRIMFPIADSSGRIVGFSGRILAADPDAPKYLNSPETQLFKKSEILFGLDKAKKDIRVKDYSILVEGQMDLIMLHQVGITNTVASSGTALSAEHLTKLRRLSGRIIMCYDGDSAGFAASDRSGKLALSLGMDLKVAQMPAGKDPADLAKDDLEELKNCLKNSKHIIDFYVDSLLSRKMESRQLGKEIQKNVLPYIAILQSNIEKSHFIKSIARKTLIKEDALWDDLKRVGIGTAADTPTSASDIPNGATTSASGRSDAIERRIVGVILWRKSPEVRKKFLETVGDERGKEILEKFERDESLLFETESYYNGNDNPSKDISELLTSLQEEILKKKLAEAMIFLNKAEQMRDSERISKYLEECQIISQKINNLKNVQKK